MCIERNRCNGLAHVPTCSTWPPPWLISVTAPWASAPPPRALAEEVQREPPTEISADAARNAELLTFVKVSARFPLGFSAEAVVVIADADGYTGRQMKGEPYMWTWINGPTWFYVQDYPIPTFGKATP